MSIFRGLARNWWKILGLWLIATLPLLYLIYSQVKPMYRATGQVEILSNQPELYSTSGPNVTMVERKIETEMAKIKSPTILQIAVADATVLNLPFIKESESAMTDLMNKLIVENPRNTNFILVSMESTSAEEAAALVNAVINYYKVNTEISEGNVDKLLVTNLENFLKEKEAQRDAKKAELVALMAKGEVDPANVTQAKATSGNQKSDDPEGSKQQSAPSLTMELVGQYRAKLFETEVQLHEARAQLAKRTEGFQNAEEIDDSAVPDAGISDDELQDRIKLAFNNDPVIADLNDQLADLKDRLDHVEKGTRKGNDLARRTYQTQIQGIKDRIKSYWEKLYPQIEQQILAAAAEGRLNAVAATSKGPAEPVVTIRQLRDKVSELEARRDAINTKLDEAKFESKKSNSDTVIAQFLQAEIDAAAADEQEIGRRLQELKFRNNRSGDLHARLNLALVPQKASDSKRLKLMAATPVAILGLLLGVFALLEIRAERVGDPDALSTRVQSEVYSLPPIPTGRSARRLGVNGDDHIDRFIQRLDHLRFAICGDHPEVGLGRCVLISSAVGSEGKTTLAAQLAARCGHAGHSTLLIDADLRRGALCPLLDVPEGQGLSDVLTREDLNVEDVVIPVQGGTFHLLCAGSPSADASRVFQGRSFGMLIARLRQLYDLIIIDSPPILPVPDALIMGRWTDGVVLASRFDVSRAPQVERARRQLDLAGIPVLGTVINGMKTSDSYYGRYSYSRNSTGPDDLDGAGEASS